MKLCLSLLAAAAALFASAAQASPTRFTAQVDGSGPDIVLIPGLASPATVWDATVEQLRDDYRVHVIHVAGFAAAPAASGAEGAVVAPLVEELAAYIAEERLEVAAVIGHSLGGEAAAMLAVRHPRAAKRIMVVDAMPFYPLLNNPAATVGSVRPMADNARAQMAAQTREQFALGQEAALTRMIKDDAARAAVLPLAARSDPGTVARAVHELMTTDLRGELARLSAPLTVVYAYDRAYGVLPEVIDRLFASAWSGAEGARFRRIDDSFHFVMLDQPEAFAAAIAEFLE